MLCIKQAVVDLLLKHKADVNSTDIDGHTALHVASANNAVNSVQCLLGIIDDINAPDSSGHTALHHAAYNGHIQVMSGSYH